MRPGDDLAGLIEEGLRRAHVKLQDGDILVVSQKVVSKAEGRVVRRGDIEPSALARRLSKLSGKEAEHLEFILRNTSKVVRMDVERGIFIMETPHGFVCANAGVDRSNLEGDDTFSSLPQDPDRSARDLRRRLETAFSVRLAVIISDTFGRPWRRGQTDVAIGVSGLSPLRDYRGTRDSFGRELKATMIAVADEVAAAAELVKGKSDGIPVAVVRGIDYVLEEGSVRELLRSKEEDLFR